jgi:hypothetical protein
MKFTYLNKLATENFLIEKIKNNYIIFIILFSLISAVYHGLYIDQRGLSAGLIISGEVNYPDKNNILYLWYNNSWSLYHHFISFLIKLGIKKIELLNIFILFLVTFVNCLGLFFITKTLTKNYLFSLFVSFVLIVTQFNFGDLDFPVLIFSEHTNAPIGSAVAILTLGLIGNRNFKIAYLLCLINIFLHSVIGLWILFILIISLFAFANKKEDYQLKSGRNLIFLTSCLTILLIFFINFNFNRIPIIYEKDIELYKEYLKVWDSHRNPDHPINYIYVSLSALMSFMILYFINFKRRILNENQKFFLKVILVHTFLSFVIYISFKMFQNLFPIILIQAMPNRLFLIHSFFGPSIIASLFFVLFYKKVSNINSIKYLTLSIIIISILFYSERYLHKIKKIPTKIVNQTYYDKQFWEKIKNDKLIDGLVLPSINACSKTIQRAKKPILICIETIDYVNYIPQLILPVKDIMEDIYKIDFSNPPEKFHGGIWKDKTYKINFESKSSSDWLIIQKKYNLSGLILPNNWNIKLKKKYIGDKFIFYTFK